MFYCMRHEAREIEEELCREKSSYDTIFRLANTYFSDILKNEWIYVCISCGKVQNHCVRSHLIEAPDSFVSFHQIHLGSIFS